MREQRTNFNLKKISALAGLGVALVTILLYSTQTWKLLFPDSEPPQSNNFLYTGKVLDSKTKLPIKDALVEIQANGVPHKFSTTNEGVFRFDFNEKAIAERGDIIVIITFSGYEKYRELKTLLINKNDIHEIYLKRVASPPPPPDTTEFYEVTLHVNADMSRAEIFVDGEPVFPEDSSTVQFKVIRVKAKPSYHEITLRSGSLSCSKKLTIVKNNPHIYFTSEDCQ